MTKHEFVRSLEAVFKNFPELLTGNPGEEIYLIDDLIIYGGFELGIRGFDHSILMTDSSLSWNDLIRWGILVIPEVKGYISDSLNDYLESLGFSQIPTCSNQFVGFH